MNKKLVIKIGTNVLIKTDGSLNTTAIQNIVHQIAKLRNGGNKIVLVSSGAMAAGKNALETGKTKFNNEVQKRQVSSAIGQPYLMRKYQDLFQKYKIIVGQVLITKLDLSTRNHYLNLRCCINGLHTQNAVPIVNENDSTAIEELMFTDNDEIAGMVASMIDADELILCTNVDGVFDGNPEKTKSKLFSTIDADENLNGFIQASKSLFGRGGMTTKIATAQKLAKLGIKVKIINGKKKNSIIQTFNFGGIGTTISPHKNVSAKKRWLAFADQTIGEIAINKCLKKTLMHANEATSILPIGVVDIVRPFKKGDLINVICEDKTQVGIGIAEKDSITLVNEIGKKNKAIIIHYDYMYINN